MRLKTYFSDLYFLHIIPISNWEEKSLFYIDINHQSKLDLYTGNSSNSWKRSNKDVHNVAYNMPSHFNKGLMQLKSSSIFLTYGQNFYVGSDLTIYSIACLGEG